MLNRLPRILACTLIAALIAAPPVLADGITIDGDLSDWAGKASFVDPDGPDNAEATPSRTDVTEFGVDIDAGGTYLLMAWDDTSFSSATGAGVTLRGADGAYYFLYVVVDRNEQILLSSLEIGSCGTDSTCAAPSTVCSGSGCTDAQVASNTNWTDPFAGRSSPDCSGANCGTQDIAGEVFVPWSLAGGAPGDDALIFLNFQSRPAGPAGSIKDDTAPNAITCIATDGVFDCYPSNPNAITLRGLTASGPAFPALELAGLAVIGISLAAFAGRRRLA